MAACPMAAPVGWGPPRRGCCRPPCQVRLLPRAMGCPRSPAPVALVQVQRSQNGSLCLPLPPRPGPTGVEGRVVGGQKR